MNESSRQAFVADRRCRNCLARHHAVCAVLQADVRHALGDIMVHKHYERGQVIWGDQDSADMFAIIVSGAVKLVKNLEDGREQIVAVMFAPACIGRLFADRQQSLAEAVTDTELCCFSRSAFERLIGRNPHIEHALFERTLHDLDRANDWITALGKMNAREKIASFLMQMMRLSEQSHCDDDRPAPNLPSFVLPLTRREIADYLGLTTETVSRYFTRLRMSGVIAMTDARFIEIRDVDALERMSGF